MQRARVFIFHVHGSWHWGGQGRGKDQPQRERPEKEAMLERGQGPLPRSDPSEMSGLKGLSKIQQILSGFLHKNFFAWQENSKSEIVKETAR